jgi:hypothetical protein
MFQISKVSCLIGIIATFTNGAPSLKIIYMFTCWPFYETNPILSLCPRPFPLAVGASAGLVNIPTDLVHRWRSARWLFFGVPQALSRRQLAGMAMVSRTNERALFDWAARGFAEGAMGVSIIILSSKIDVTPT